MNNDEIADVVSELKHAVSPGARFKLVARGLSRGMIWRNGTLPDGAPEFSENLSADLLDHGYSVLSLALSLRDAEREPDLVETAFRVAAESIESTCRKGDIRDPSRGFDLVVAAAAFHLSHFAARSYCLIPSSLSGLNLSSAERAIALLMRRSLKDLRLLCVSWLVDDAHSDDAVSARLENSLDEFGFEDAVAMALTRNFFRAIALFDFALSNGSQAVFIEARQMLVDGTSGAAEANHVPQWWVNTLARHLVDDLWANSFHTRLPLLSGEGEGERWNTLRGQFISALAEKDVSQVDLWPSQLEAARRAIEPTDDLIVALPTSAGKTRIAELCILRCLASGKRVVYVTPLRALSAQVEWTLSRVFRPLGHTVSSLYGASGVAAADIGSLESSDIVVATPEKLDFAIRQQPAVLDNVGLVVLDEGHMIGRDAREIRYEVLVQRLLQRSDANVRRLVCLSAIFSSGDSFDDFTAWLRADNEGSPIRSDWRPTRQRPGVLVWSGSSGKLDLVVDDEKPYVPSFVRSEALVGRRKKRFPNGPKELVWSVAKAFVRDGNRVLVYCPQRGSVEGLAEECLKLNRQGYFPSILRDDELVERARRVGIEWLGEDHVAVKALAIGIAVHHGALPRAFLSEVERLLNEKVLPVAIASPTLAQGIDLSCSALIFYSIFRAGNPIDSSEFANVIGRAGRAYVDLDGLYVYPVADDRKGRYRRSLYERLQQKALSRSMESGIVLLIDELAQRFAVSLGMTREQVIEYVTNHEGPWSAATPALETGKFAKNEDDDEQLEGALAPIEEIIADLDVTILGTVENLACDPRDLAEALDTALRSSLWRRRLNRQSLAHQELQRAVLYGRAKWLWGKSTSEMRQGCFAAGIGFDAGTHISDHLTSLIQELTIAEAAVFTGDAAVAAASITKMADVLFRVHPFIPEELPINWQNLLGEWMRGTPLGEMLGRKPQEEVGFVQQAIVFQLVWGLEAIRVQALAAGEVGADLLTGSAAFALTYGVPSLQAAMICEAGLTSRPMAVRLTRGYFAEFTEKLGLAIWLAEVRDTVKKDGFWKSDAERKNWAEFLTRWGEKIRVDWSQSTRELEVSWDPFHEPQPGDEVRIIDDVENSVTNVCDRWLSVIGTVIGRYPAANSGLLRAEVSRDVNKITVQRWGPTG